MVSFYGPPLLTEVLHTNKSIVNYNRDQLLQERKCIRKTLRCIFVPKIIFLSKYQKLLKREAKKSKVLEQKGQHTSMILQPRIRPLPVQPTIQPELL